MSNRRKIRKQPPAVWLYRHTIKSAAWKASSVGARATYFVLASNYNTNMQNAVYLSVRTGSKELGANKDTVTKWLRELEFYGFIALVQRGTIGVYGYGRATQYRLTDRPYAGSPPTHDFQNWSGEIFDAKKQNPVLLGRTPRPKKPDIEKSSQQGSLCPKKPDIRAASGCPKKPDITSLASYQVLKANAARLSVAAGPTSLAAVTNSLSPSATAWSTPVLTEIPYTPELRQFFLDEEKPPAHAPIGHNAGPPLHDDNDLSIPPFLLRGHPECAFDSSDAADTSA